MSEHPTSIVDIDVGLGEASAKAAEMVAWLQAEGIIGEGVQAGKLHREWLGSGASNPMFSDLVDDPRIVYRPGPHIGKAATADLSTLFKNWLEVDIERKVYTAGENGIGVVCTACKSDQTERGEAWGNAISDWYDGGVGLLACAACGFQGQLRQWTFDPVWAFGNLGFTFCDWQLKPDFIAAFRKKLGHESRVVHAHL